MRACVAGPVFHGSRTIFQSGANGPAGRLVLSSASTVLATPLQRTITSYPRRPLRYRVVRSTTLSFSTTTLRRNSSATKENRAAETSTERMLRILLASPQAEWSAEEQSLVQAWQNNQAAQIAHDQSNNQDSSLALLISLGRLAQAFQDLNWWDAALETEETLAPFISTFVGGHNLTLMQRLQGDSFFHQGRCHVFLRRADLARTLYTQAMDCYTRAACSVGMGDVWVALAGLEFQAHNYEAALQKLQQAEPYYEKTSHDNTSSREDDEIRGLVRCLQQQGLIHRLQEDFTKALDVYRRAASHASVLSDDERSRSAVLGGVISFRSPKHKPRSELIQELTLDQADMHLAIDEYDTALSLYQSLLPDGMESSHETNEASTTKPTTTHAVVWHSMGKIHARLERHDQAVACFKRSLALKRRFLPPHMPYHPELAKTLHALGAAYAAMSGHRGEAVACFQEALLIARAGVAPGESPDRDPLVVQAMQNLQLLEDNK